MGRLIGGIVAGILVWWISGATGFAALRWTWPAYAAVEPTYAFTMAMLLSRLFVAIVCGIAAGAVTVLVVGRPSAAPWIVGAIQLAIFVPIHVMAWQYFPVWYHLFFLVTLAPLLALGGALAQRRSNPRSAVS